MLILVDAKISLTDVSKFSTDGNSLLICFIVVLSWSVTFLVLGQHFLCL
jgi:hypothetical protein